MPSISFSFHDTLPIKPADFAAELLVLENWKQFTGYGPVPGIVSAEFEQRTPEVVGTRIRVVEGGGSTHIEEIVEWQPERCLRLRFCEFSAPLSFLASEFVESFEFEPTGDQTRVTRSMTIEARSFLTWPMLWILSFFIKAALARHLEEIKQAAEAKANAAPPATVQHTATGPDKPNSL